MALWRVRATVDDRPGFLSVLTASLALKAVNILAVQVQAGVPMGHGEQHVQAVAVDAHRQPARVGAEASVLLKELDEDAPVSE